MGSEAATPSRTTASTDCGASGRSTRTRRGGDATGLPTGATGAAFCAGFQPSKAAAISASSSALVTSPATTSVA
ncbi:MAG: hypothetical protein QM820_05240 [Minicystis sp.]